MSEDPNPVPARHLEPRRSLLESLIPLGILAVWLILQIWVLPKAGVPT